MKLLPVLAAVLLVTTACTEDEGEPPVPAKAEPTADPFAVSCPLVPIEKREVVDFRAVDRAAPALPADLTVYPLSPRNFCVGADTYDASPAASRIVSYTVELDQADNYGERYSTFIRRGSEELLNFPFYFHVYNRCRVVTATIIVRSRGGTEHTYRVATHVGPKCDQA